jgi:uncharacterized damage-inducible protein DinB
MLISTLTDEIARTKRLLNAYPAAQSEMKPHPTSNTARQLVHTLCVEAVIGTAAANGTLDASKITGFPPAPATWGEVMAAFDGAYAGLIKEVEKMSEADFDRSVKFLTGPKQVSPMPAGAVLWFMLSDHIHHRGQLSVYLRMTGSKVPSIYGPSKDEPWN